MTLRRVAPYAFVEAPLDRAENLRDDSAALARLWAGGRALVIDAEGRARATTAGALLAPPAAELAEGPGDALFLGLRGEEGWFALREEALADGPAGTADAADTAATDEAAAARIDLRSAAATWPDFEATAFAQARAVLHWRARHRFCGACGGPLAFRRAGWLGHCAACDLEHYPRTDPAVIVAVSDGERLLLGRGPGWAPRRYSVLAGFVEPGESLEQTVVREVFEESSVRVLGCGYLGSQPWPFPSSLMLGFEAEAAPDVPHCPSDELEDARWFSRDEVGAALRGETDPDGLLLSPTISISRWLIERWHARA
ncbi:NAD(+) diphosphatase [Luteimonas sp. MC1750]|uniref:NAD(+) diphosphatase n=1 Tax=Luteimonas sp. MC1750 TaxID=2799326 RepID=UPI0018F0F330|nr:NAD(+) diphosphatase [Luteimonas sp. MC1750]MBJ6983387.1 NAD(+) diphosphatase [Luteimonas sp. MC1750]QQO06242.1 NAD(+) diphosphatase [Luteimonas sp. MC1750]